MVPRMEHPVFHEVMKSNDFHHHPLANDAVEAQKQRWPKILEQTTSMKKKWQGITDNTPSKLQELSQAFPVEHWRQISTAKKRDNLQ